MLSRSSVLSVNDASIYGLIGPQDHECTARGCTRTLPNRLHETRPSGHTAMPVTGDPLLLLLPARKASENRPLAVQHKAVFQIRRLFDHHGSQCQFAKNDRIACLSASALSAPFVRYRGDILAHLYLYSTDLVSIAETLVAKGAALAFAHVLCLESIDAETRTRAKRSRSHILLWTASRSRQQATAGAGRC